MTDTTTTLVSSLNPSSFSDSVSFTATVVSNDLVGFPGPPTGTVTFFDGANPLATRALSGGVATYSTSALNIAGSPHDITAVYNGDADFNGSTSNHVSQVVNAATTTVEISATGITYWNAPPLTYPIGTVVFTVSVTGGGTPTGTVHFFIDGVEVATGNLSGGQTTHTTAMTGYTLGAHSVYATYDGDGDHAAGVSSVITQSVDPNNRTLLAANPVTDISGYYNTPDWLIVDWPNTNPQTEGQPVRILAWVQTAVQVGGPDIFPEGTLTLRDGATVLATASLILGNGVNPGFSYAEFVVSTLSPGTHMLSVDYGGMTVGGDVYFTPSSGTGYITGVHHESGTAQVIIAAGGGEPAAPVPPADQPVAPNAPPATTRSCPTFINCPGSDRPIANYSSEAPDPIQFLGLSFGPFPMVPPLGSSFSALGCLAICNSTLSQTDADLCAARQAIECTTSDWHPPEDTVFYWNTAQACIYTCPETGAHASSTTAEHTFEATTQEAADALAHEFACLNARLLVDCVQEFSNVAKSCTYACPANGVEISYTTAAGTFTAATQTEADQLAYSYACLIAEALAMASLNCSGPPAPTCANPPCTTTTTYGNRQQQCTTLCPNGLPFTWVVPAGTFIALSQLEADAQAYSFACRQAQVAKVCLSSLPERICAGTSTSLTITASGVSPTAVNLWELTAGSVPPGTTLTTGFRATTAILSGTPTTAGNYSFSIRVTRPDGTYMQRVYALCVDTILPAALPDATIGTAYAQALSMQCDEIAAAWFIASGTLPPGITLDSENGVLSGTPTSTGSFTFTIRAQTP